MKLITSILFIVVSLALLIPGVTQPILTINGTIEKAELVDAGLDMLAENLSAEPNSNARNMLDMAVAMFGFDDIEGEVAVFHKSRSILETIEELYRSSNIFVAALVGLFSVAIPTIKLLIMLGVNLTRGRTKTYLINIMQAISKWSMADVFVVALIVVYMAGNASAGMGDILVTSSTIEPGFYFFLGYCVFSIISQALVDKAVNPPRQKTL
ncbi:paraquat-inducible protein A [Shewanella gaetbuli]